MQFKKIQDLVFKLLKYAFEDLRVTKMLAKDYRQTPSLKLTRPSLIKVGWGQAFSLNLLTIYT